MQTSDELLNPPALSENVEEAMQPAISQAEIQRLMQQYGLWNNKPKSRHAKARAEAAKARITKRKAKRK